MRVAFEVLSQLANVTVFEQLLEDTKKAFPETLRLEFEANISKENIKIGEEDKISYYPDDGTWELQQREEELFLGDKPRVSRGLILGGYFDAGIRYVEENIEQAVTGSPVSYGPAVFGARIVAQYMQATMRYAPPVPTDLETIDRAFKESGERKLAKMSYNRVKEFYLTSGRPPVAVAFSFGIWRAANQQKALMEYSKIGWEEMVEAAFMFKKENYSLQSMDVGKLVKDSFYDIVLREGLWRDVIPGLTDIAGVLSGIEEGRRYAKNILDLRNKVEEEGAEKLYQKVTKSDEYIMLLGKIFRMIDFKIIQSQVDKQKVISFSNKIKIY